MRESDWSSDVCSSDLIPSFVMPYYTDTHALAIFAVAITIIGFCAFITWVLFGIMLKKYLQKYQRRPILSWHYF
jgi:threonine/homoserine/homoserine lactone efflux protein